MLFQMRIVIALLALFMGACSSSDAAVPDGPVIPVGSIRENGTSSCTATWFRYPTTPSDFSVLYANRGFYTDGNHLGHDIKYVEGTAIYPIACGNMRVYRASTGYGRLAVVIEHTLASPVTVKNGLGQNVSVKTFLSIYGHLRTSKAHAPNGSVTDLDFRPGDGIGSEETLGYVDADATNGDGAEHLHLGIRLQSWSDAVASDPYPFRGYDDAVSSKRKWFADPNTFLSALMKANVAVRWHPPGTVVTRSKDGTHWKIGNGSLSFIPDSVFKADHLSERDIPISDEEFHCLGGKTADAVSELSGHDLVRFTGRPTIYEYDGSKRWSFLNQASFASWGWAFGDEAVQPASEELAFLDQKMHAGYRNLREGSLVKATGESEVSVVSDGRRLPIYDWATFLALGYSADHIHDIEPSVIDQTAGPRGPVITPDDIQLCHTPTPCVTDCDPTPPPFGEDAGSSPLPTKDAGTSPVNDAGMPPQAQPDAESAATDHLLLHYAGPVSGAYALKGWWPGHSWNVIAFCADTNASDMQFDCDLGAISGASQFEFQVDVPDGRFWGDQSCASGGCGSPVGTLTLSKNGVNIPYTFTPNPSGAPYYNGRLAPVP